ncbi:MAG: hypothetical protein RR779_15365 [Comamonas sp.]
MRDSDQITADFSTLTQHATMTVDGYLRTAIASIDEALGKGYAAAHPDLVAAYIAAAASDCNAAVTAKVNSAALREIGHSVMALSTAMDRISDSIDGISAAMEE